VIVTDPSTLDDAADAARGARPTTTRLASVAITTAVVAHIAFNLFFGIATKAPRQKQPKDNTTAYRPQSLGASSKTERA
jgi:hypothetical protein